MILACDLGGSSLRVALVDTRGVTHHLVSVVRAAGDDPAGWWAVLAAACERLANEAGAAFDGVAAVAIAAFTRSPVLLNASGEVLAPSMLWNDGRAAAVVDELRARLPFDHTEAATLNAFHPLARLVFLGPPAGLAWVVEPKDYLNFRLTGRIATDSVSSARLIAASMSGPDGRSLLDAAGLPRGLVPDVLVPTGIMGHVQAGLPGVLARLEGVPVLAMAHDSWAAVIGLGALRPGYGYNLSGTTEVLGVISPHSGVAEGLLTLEWGAGLQQIGGPSQTGADSVTWLLNLVGRAAPIGEALSVLLNQPREEQPLLFLPYLQGERAPYWNAALRGAFVGLNRRHGPVDLVWAVLEGVAFLNRVVLERAETASGAVVQEIRFGGGGAANAVWCQIKADVTGRAVALVDGAEPGLVGAAIVAFAALGVVAGLDDGQARMVRPFTVFTPRPAQVAFYNELYAQFRLAEAALVPISQALAKMQAA